MINVLLAIAGLALPLPVQAQAGVPRHAPARKHVQAKQAQRPKAKPLTPGIEEADAVVQSAATMRVADWIATSGDNGPLPYIIIDKPNAALFLFDAKGNLLGTAPVLIGVAVGDEATPGVGSKNLAEIGPAEKTTPAGRFVVSMGSNASGKTVVWVDYDAAISMHRVINTNPKERRPHRLETPTPRDNRISYGCINVPIKFFDDIVQPSFEGTDGIVYILPEVHPIRSVFAAAYDSSAPLRAKSDAGEKTAEAPDLHASVALRAGVVHRVAAREDSLRAAPLPH